MSLSATNSIPCFWNQWKSEINFVFVLKTEHTLGGARNKKQSLFCIFLSPFLLSPPSYIITTGQSCLLLTVPRNTRLSSWRQQHWDSICSHLLSVQTLSSFYLHSSFPSKCTGFCTFDINTGNKTSTGILCLICPHLTRKSSPEFKNYIKCPFYKFVVDVLFQWK